MRIVLACIACTIGCGFRSTAVMEDASTDIDASPVPDARIDAPPDAASLRTRAGLIGLWEFDEQGGSVISDTSDTPTKVPLTVSPPGSVTFSDSTMTPVGTALIASSGITHVNADIIASRAVTLEAWVMPALADQGTVAAPVLVAGLSASPMSRNISLMQAGTHWLARVRNNNETADDKNGKPDLISTIEITAGEMTHLVVVADETQRILYVNGRPDTVDAEPRQPFGWSADYPMVLGLEWNQSRKWVGTFALVALFKTALTQARIELHHTAGP